MKYPVECLIEYLKKYNITLKTEEIIGIDGFTGDLKLSTKDRQLGHLHYLVDLNEKNINIEWVTVSRSRPDIIRIVFLHLLSTHSDSLDTASLTSSHGNDITKAGTEFCLLCFYQKLGFEPMNYETVRLVKKCKKKLKKIIDNCEEFSSMCLLCQCQRHDINFTEETEQKFSSLRVDMKALIPVMKDMLKEAYREVKKSA